MPDRYSVHSEGSPEPWSATPGATSEDFDLAKDGHAEQLTGRGRWLR
jgi:hypothetical protein